MKELAAFGKTDVLAPGESQILDICYSWIQWHPMMTVELQEINLAMCLRQENM